MQAEFAMMMNPEELISERDESLLPASMAVAQRSRCKLSAAQTLQSGGCELGACGATAEGRGTALPAVVVKDSCQPTCP